MITPTDPNRSYRHEEGQLLLELLISIAVAAVIFGAGGQIVVVSLQGNKVAAEKNVANGLVQETLEAVQAATLGKWSNVFSLARNSDYHPTQSSGSWVISSAGPETFSSNNVNYTRSFVVQNVCRDSNGAIAGITDSSGTTTACTPPSNRHDPSTQKITVTVSWPAATAITVSDYVTRWPNKTCVETSWSTPEGAANLQSCNSGSFETQANIDYTTAPGSLTITP